MYLLVIVKKNTNKNKNKSVIVQERNKDDRYDFKLFPLILNHVFSYYFIMNAQVYVFITFL